MPNISFDEISYQVQPHVPAAPYPTVMAALRQATVDVCRETGAWRAQAEAFRGDAPIRFYEPYTPSGTMAVAPVWVRVDGRDIEFRGDELVGVDNHGSAQRCYWDGEGLHFDGVIVAGAELSVRVSLRPTPNAEGIDVRFFDKAREAIVELALSRLFDMTGAVYGNASEAARRRQLAEYAIMRLKSSTRNNGVRVKRSIMYGGI